MSLPIRECIHYHTLMKMYKFKIRYHYA